MKKYIKEIILLIVQILMFYLLPLFAGPTDAMGMVAIMLIMTFLISLIGGSIINNKLKIYYPIIIAIVFVPSVFIYYNESALIHSLWYLIDSYIGLVCGNLLKKIIKQVIKWKKI